MKHGHRPAGSRTPTYQAWENMVARCYAPSSKSYCRYGARGIKVCHRWRQFKNFLTDMGERPDGLTLERKNNKGNYTPENCKWASRREQANNRRTNVKLRLGNITKTIADWARTLNVRPDLLWARINRLHWTTKRALTTPVATR